MKKQIVDNVTELDGGPGRSNIGFGSQTENDVSNIVTQPHFLPSSRTVMRLLEIQRDPLAHFLPTRVTPTGTYFFAGPPGLAPELGKMFMKPVMNLLASKKRAASPGGSPTKRARLDGSVVDEAELEQARRDGSRAPSLAIGSDVLGRASVGPGLDGGFDFNDNTGTGIDDFQLDVDMITGQDVERQRSKSRMSTPAAEGDTVEDGIETYADSSCPIAMFDDRGAQSQSQGPEKDQDAIDGQGYSKNTVKALGVIRKDLHSAAGEAAEKHMSFQQMCHKVCFDNLSDFVWV